MKRLTRPVLLMALALTAVLLLCSCSASGGKDAGGDTTGPAQTDTQTVQGTVNQIDTGLKYLVVATDDDYCCFDFSDSDADLSGLEPGDSVTVTYTGTLDSESEEVTATLVSIEKN